MTFRFLASGLSFISIFYYHKRLKHTYTVFKTIEKSLILRLITLEITKSLGWDLNPRHIGCHLEYHGTYRSRVQIPPKANKMRLFCIFKHCDLFVTFSTFPDDFHRSINLKREGDFVPSVHKSWNTAENSF